MKTMSATMESRPAVAATRNVAYQELKSRIHQDLLNRLNLERLARVKREEAEPEIRSLIAGMLDRERDKTPLSLYEREAIVADVLHELFGLGPLEVLLGGSDDLGHSRQPTRSGVHRTKRPAGADRHHLQGRASPASDHRADRELGGPAHRRIEPDGGRAACRWLPRQRHHSAAGARWLGDVDPPLPHRQARRRRPGGPGVVDGADEGLSRGGGRLPTQRGRLGWHRRRQDDPAQHPVELHRRARTRGHD